MLNKMLDEIKDVEASVWISASAGTGKTKSLIDRILALLLNNADPSKILCLTYTKAAATEMLERLSSLVQKFSLLSDTELIVELNSLGFNSNLHLKTAKKLYEKSLIASNWVQIKTIHSFCLEILKKFPLETGLFPGITVCDDYQRKHLLKEATEKILFEGNYKKYSEFVSRFTIDINEILAANIIKFQKFLSKTNNFKSLYCDFFKIENEEIIFSEHLDTFLAEQIFKGRHKEIFFNLANMLFEGEKEDIKKAEILSENANNISSDFVYAFLTKELEPRSKLCSKELSKRYPNLQQTMEEITQLALQFCNKKKLYVSSASNIAIFTLVEKILDKFSELKRINHCIDFDDIIVITSSLLNNIEWVMYKIDNSIDHLLVDEAQDTSPEQWQIINAITDEFFANYKSSKTVFVVGDEKQSIYSFQGADIQIFQKMHQKFKERSVSNGQKFHDITLNKSYRTTGNILNFVDDIFQSTKHYSNREENFGVVDIVDLFEDENNEEQNNILNTKFSEPQLSAEKKLSQYIADFIKNTIESKTFVESKKREAVPSDFMILFQRRDIKVMKEIIKDLRKNEIPVSEIDRGLLKNEIIVEDLIALAQFAIFPLDDLVCARVFKSPIVSMSEEDLMNLCLNRADENLWNYSLSNEKICERYNLLELKKIVDQASFLSVCDFFSEILTNSIKEKFISRLGSSCLEALYDFIDTVVIYENGNTASLQSFLKWFHNFKDDIEIKHESSSNGVRLMTVHASKGLQAPFVILADTHFYKNKNSKIFQNEDGILLWNFDSEMETESIKEIHKKYNNSESDESKRRLYVALTRAEDYLCVLGKKQEKMNNDCWYNFIKERKNENKFQHIIIGDMNVLRIGDFRLSSTKNIIDNTSEKNIKKNFFEKIQNELENLPPLTLPASLNKSINNSSENKENIMYGDCVHLLLKELPNYAAPLYEIFADNFVDKFDINDEAKKKAKREALQILRNKKFSFVFDNKSLSEVTVIENEKENRIDKIAFLNNEVWIIDFKTGRYYEKIPDTYVEQLRRYKNSVKHLFRDKKIITAILWTEEARLEIAHCEEIVD